MKRIWVLPCLPILSLTVVCVFVKWDSAFKLLSQIPVIGLIVGQNFQPSDYKNPRLDIPLSIGEKNVRFSCKYRGRHEIDIVGCNVNPWEQSMLGLRMAVTDVKGTSLYHTVRSNEVALLTFDENGRRYMRFCYAVLDIPGDLPADTPLFLSFSCFGNYEAFQRRNPDARLVLRKFTDK